MAKLRRGMNRKPSAKMLADMRRYKEKERKAVAADIEYIVGKQSIMTKKGQKDISVRLRSLTEYELQYDSDPDEGEGIVMGSGGDQDSPFEDGSVAISQDEIMQILAEHLDLIDLLELVRDEQGESGKHVPIGQSKTGSDARLNRKATIKQKIARALVTGADSGFKRSDKRFRFLEEVPEKDKRAIIYVVQDVSGSMSRDQRFIVRSLYSILVYSLRKMYKSLEIVFISHEAKAREESEDNFFQNMSVGGTHISSGPLKALEIQKARYGGDPCDVFFWHATDGFNEQNDNPKLVEALEQICKITRLACVCVTGNIAGVGNISELQAMAQLQRQFPHFVLSKITDKSQIKKVLFECFEKGVTA